MPPAVLNPNQRPEGASCGACALRLIGIEETCAFVHKDGTADCRVSFEKGVCGLYIGGRPVGADRAMPTVSRSVAGYYEGPGVPTHCGNCEYFQSVGGESRSGTCTKVEGLVNAFGCCNFWSQDDGD